MKWLLLQDDYLKLCCIAINLRTNMKNIHHYRGCVECIQAIMKKLVLLQWWTKNQQLKVGLELFEYTFLTVPVFS